MARNSSVRSNRGQTIKGSMDSLDTQCGYVWNGFTICNKLQSLGKPYFFMVMLILQGIIQGIFETFFLKTILSTKFGVPYATTRWLILGSEVALLIIAIPVIYWGSERRRPGWLAGSTIFLSVCSILFASQLLSEHRTNTPDSFSFSRDSNLCQPWYQSFWNERWKWNWVTIIIIPVLRFAVGMNIIAYWAFGISYIDDNAANNLSPLFIGVAFALKQFGPFIGLFVSSLSITTTLMGIYWLIMGGTALLIAILTGMFPKKLPGSSIHQAGDSGLIPAFQRIFTNKIIIFSGLTAASLLSFIINATALEEKYIESTFYVTGNSLFNSIFSIRYLFGILKPTVAAVSILISGIIIYRMKPRALFLCIWSIISICLAAGAMFAIIFFKCSDTPIHRENSRNNLEEYCNVNCGCSYDLPFTPTCTPFYPFVYYSPCHAGCTTSFVRDTAKIYSNCSCVPTGSVEVGHCNGGKCRTYWWLFQLLILLCTAFLASGIIGTLLICFRSILPCDKTVMVGAILTVSSFIARVPFKILYDFIANFSCLYFIDGQCKIYNSDTLATYINLLHISLLLSGAGMLTIICFLVQDLHLYGNDSSVKNNSEPMTEMSDFRSQLNQALKSRRESAAEEQKLLSESVTQTSRLHGHENGNRASFIEEHEKQKSSVNGQKRLSLPKPLIPVKSPLLNDDKTNENCSPHSTLPSSQLRLVDASPIQKPPVPVKSAALVNEIKASLSNSSINSTPPASPTHSAGTTVRNQGYLTTLL